MSTIQLFHIQDSVAIELTATTATRERDLQRLIEARMETFLGVRFLATEYATGKTHRGRIDSLGVDENNCPVIIEYKRYSNQNIITQGLFYLDWSFDHKAEFFVLVMNKLGKDVADRLEWSGARLLCIASDFTHYDLHAIQQMPRNIELLRYKQFINDLLLLELVNTQTEPSPTEKKAPSSITEPPSSIAKSTGKTFTEQLSKAQTETQALYADLRHFSLALGDDVTEKQLKRYVTFRKLRNFACVVMFSNKIVVYLNIKPDTVKMQADFSRDVREVGHLGTGHVELTLRDAADFERAKPLLERAYREG